MAAVADPYANVSPPAEPSCTNAKITVNANGKTNSISPGCYRGDITVNAGATLNLSPGIYYLDGANLSVAGNATITGSGVTLVDFWAEWCGPCRRLAPTVEALATEYDGRITVAKMNVDENPNTPGRFMIRGIPTMLIFKNGELADQIVGLVGKEEITRKLDAQL